MDRLLTAFVTAVMGSVFATIELAVERYAVGAILLLAVGAQFVTTGVTAWLATCGLGLIALATAKRLAADDARVVRFGIFHAVVAVLYGVMLGVRGDVGFAIGATFAWIVLAAVITLFMPSGD